MTWVAEARSNRARLPCPSEGIGLEQLRFGGLPAHALATAGQKFGIGRTESDGPVLIDLEQGHAFGQAFGGEDDSNGEPMGSMLDGGFTPAGTHLEAVTDGAVDTDVQGITAPFCFSQRDKDTVFVSAAETVHWRAGFHPVVGEDVTFAPGIVDIRCDMVLQQADLLALAIDGLLATCVTQLKRVFEVEYFVEANGAFRVDAGQQVPGTKDDGRPVRVQDAEQRRPQRGQGLPGGHYRQRNGLLKGCQDSAQLPRRCKITWKSTAGGLPVHNASKGRVDPVAFTIACVESCVSGVNRVKYTERSNE